MLFGLAGSGGVRLHQPRHVFISGEIPQGFYDGAGGEVSTPEDSGDGDHRVYQSDRDAIRGTAVGFGDRGHSGDLEELAPGQFSAYAIGLESGRLLELGQPVSHLG